MWKRIECVPSFVCIVEPIAHERKANRKKRIQKQQKMYMRHIYIYRNTFSFIERREEKNNNIFHLLCTSLSFISAVWDQVFIFILLMVNKCELYSVWIFICCCCCLLLNCTLFCLALLRFNRFRLIQMFGMIHNRTTAFLRFHSIHLIEHALVLFFVCALLCVMYCIFVLIHLSTTFFFSFLNANQWL